jgi:hypothetical protein
VQQSGCDLFLQVNFVESYILVTQQSDKRSRDQKRNHSPQKGKNGGIFTFRGKRKKSDFQTESLQKIKNGRKIQSLVRFEFCHFFMLSCTNNFISTVMTTIGDTDEKIIPAFGRSRCLCIRLFLRKTQPDETPRRTRLPSLFQQQYAGRHQRPDK